MKILFLKKYCVVDCVWPFGRFTRFLKTITGNFGWLTHKFMWKIKAIVSSPLQAIKVFQASRRSNRRTNYPADDCFYPPHLHLPRPFPVREPHSVMNRRFHRRQLVSKCEEDRLLISLQHVTTISSSSTPPSSCYNRSKKSSSVA